MRPKTCCLHHVLLFILTPNDLASPRANRDPSATACGGRKTRATMNWYVDPLPLYAAGAAATLTAGASNFTDTSRETPGSCMVTPYMAWADSIVFLEWVMMTNWVPADISRRRRMRRPMLAS